MKIITIGDSFTYGDELAIRNNAWPFVLQTYLECELVNAGVSGSGNTKMVRTVIDNIDKFDMFIIAWSHFARTELSDEHGTYDTWPGNSSRYHSAQGTAHRDTIINYYNKHHNDVYMYKQYLLNIILTQRYLEANNKKYIMVDVFGNDMYRRAMESQPEQLMNQIDNKYFVGWPDETMMDWTKGMKCGPKGHFLDDGHAKVAGIIYEHIRIFGWA